MGKRSPEIVNSSNVPRDPRPALSLTDYDHRLSEHVSSVFAEINTHRFRDNVQAFSNITQRLPHVIALKGYRSNARRTIITSSSIKDPDLFHDNVFQLQGLFQQLLKIGGHPCSEAEEIYRSMVALLAVLHGCTSDLAFFLSTADQLLDRLRTCIGNSATLTACYPN